MTTVNVCLAQINTLVGDITGNAEKIIENSKYAASHYGADIIVFPELTLTAYPPEDLLFRSSLKIRVDEALEQISTATNRLDVHIVIGLPWSTENGIYNAAIVMCRGEVINRYHKQELPNYEVFDEQRYFIPGEEAATFKVKGVRFGLSICEDIWHEGPTAQAKEYGAQCLLNLNASPFHIDKLKRRQELLVERSTNNNIPIIYVNTTGGQDELVFDGVSMAYNQQGECSFRAPAFEEGLYNIDVIKSDNGIAIGAGELAPEQDKLESIYNALVTGVRDYINKNGFRGAVLGLSGGIDSAVTLAIAADALGAERVMAVMMPFHYTSDISKEDAALEAESLGVDYDSIAIESIYDSFIDALSGQFKGADVDTTEENLQARCRGVLLMAISNKKGYLVLTTGNKSENAVGYSTLYGDMAGGFNVLKDVSKILVYQLAEYRNSLSDSGPIIPQRVIDRPPSAELAPDQKDEDSLPPYDVLDRILEMYIELDYSAEAIIAEGFDREDVYRVVRLVDINEYKRRQAPVGPKVTRRAFGRDRRYPITNGWKPGK